MKLFLKLLLALVLWGIFLGLCIGASLLFDFPIEVAIRVFLLVFVFWYLFKLCRFVFLRWRAKQRVEKLINRDTTTNGDQKLSFVAFLLPSNIDKHLHRLLKWLAKSKLSQAQGTATEVKWLMHLKLGNAQGVWVNEPAVMRPQWHDPILSEIEHAHWQVFNEFLLLDVDHYLLDEGNETAQSEWIEWLDALSYCDKSMSLDGLVVSINIHQLADPVLSNQLADSLRGYVEQIKTHCAVDVAVSFVLEGLDELPSVTAWADGLSVMEKSSPLGLVNGGHETFESLTDSIFTHLKAQLSTASLLHLMKSGFDVDAASLPTQVENITEQLNAFGYRCLRENQFQASPRVNGIFFTVNTTQHSLFIGDLLENRLLLTQAAKSLSLTTHADQQKRKKLGVYWLASISLMLIMALVQNNDRASIEGLFEDYQAALVKTDDLSAQAANLNQRYELIQALGNVSLGHWLPLNSQVIDAAELRLTLANDIQRQVLSPVDRQFSQSIGTFEGSIDQRVDYLNILIRRANILRAAIGGASFERLMDLPQPYDSYYIENLDDNIIQQLNSLSLRLMQLHYQANSQHALVQWQDDLDSTRQQVAKILLSSEGNLSWLTTWVNKNSVAAEVSFEDYWGREVVNSPRIPPAYTRVGKQNVDDVLAQITQVMGDNHPFVVRHLAEYQRQYTFNYAAKWRVFLEQFMTGVEALKTRQAWLEVINNLPTGRNIFFKLLNDADYELSVLNSNIDSGSWLDFLYYYQDMLAQSGDQIQSNTKKNKLFTKLALKVIGATGSVGKAVAKSGKSSLKTKAKFDKAGAGAGASEREINLQGAADTLDQYKKGLAELVFNIEQRPVSLLNMQGLYTNNSQPSAADSSLGNVHKQIDTLHSLIGKRGHSSEAFWAVFTGPTGLLQMFMRKESGCELNQRWADDFLFQLYGVPEYKLSQVVYGETGLLWSYIDEQLTPYLRKGVSGSYGLQRAAGKTMPIDNQFIKYLSQAKDSMTVQQFESFNLGVTIAPTSVNEKSMLYVSSTQLTLHCADAEQVIVNRNFIDTQPISWQQTCNRLDLQFQVGNRTLIREYKGRKGIIEFLQAFSSGKVRFDAESFVQHFYLLQQYQVRHLDVSISVAGGDKLLKHLTHTPPAPPQTISQCWSSGDGR